MKNLKTFEEFITKELVFKADEYDLDYVSTILKKYKVEHKQTKTKITISFNTEFEYKTFMISNIITELNNALKSKIYYKRNYYL